MEWGGFSRRLNHWHGEAALKRVHASLHNYPLCIETTTIIKDAERGLISTSKNGSWSVTEHAVRGPCTRMLGWLLFISTFILFVKLKTNECVTNILTGSLKISMAHRCISWYCAWRVRSSLYPENSCSRGAARPLSFSRLCQRAAGGPENKW